MADKTFSLATDSMQLQVDGITESDGIYSVPVTIARHMVQDYNGLKVLKPATELAAAVAYMDKIPITRDHPDAGIVTDRAQVYGFITDPLFENDELKGILQTADKDLVADIEAKKLTGLSYGFFCNVERTPGTFGDAAYDAIQTDIFPNHVALLEGDLGRCSLADGCGIHTDSKETKPPEPTPEPTPDAADATLAKVTAERDALKADLEAIIKTEKDALIAELTAMQDTKTKDDLEKLKLDELKKELDMVKELRTDRLSFKKGGQPAKSAVDAAYDKVGR
jgi:hypothetical protein